MESLIAGLLRLPLLGRWLEQFLTWCYRTVSAAMRRARRNTVRPREWSNCELRKFADKFSGRVINVSGWRDEDKRGGHYRDYFSRAESYAVSNFSGARGSEGENKDGLFIDLESPLAPELHKSFQVAFNHTTLEHVFDIRRAIENICALSNDTVILVTPFLQPVHYEEGSYGDYWRPTPMCLNRILAECGFTTLYQSCNDTPWYHAYIFTVACRDPHRDLGPGVALDVPIAGINHFQN